MSKEAGQVLLQRLFTSLSGLTPQSLASHQPTEIDLTLANGEQAKLIVGPREVSADFQLVRGDSAVRVWRLRSSPQDSFNGVRYQERTPQVLTGEQVRQVLFLLG